MKRHLTPTAVGAATIALGAAIPASAQDTRDQQIAALMSRVATLEEQAARPPLSYGENNTTFEIYGYVKGDLIYDFDYDLGNTIFGLGGIDGDTPEETNFQAIAWQTRLGLRTTTPTAIGDVETQIETDFYGDGGGQLRLRHARVMWNGFEAGRYWTQFMPLAAYPGTLDFQGPAGIPFQRQTQFGYLHEFGNGAALGGYIEDPVFDSEMPAFVGVASYEMGNYFVRGTALYGQIDDENETDVWGFNLSGTADVGETTSLTAQFTYGEAIASYMVFSNEIGTEGETVFEDLNASGEAIETFGTTLGLVQTITDQFDVWAAYGYREDDNASAGATSSYETVHLTAAYSPLENVTLGVEYIYGERDIADGPTIRADRLQGAVQVNF